MIAFPNAKINLGLQILSKFPDGFHSIRSVFYPIGLKDKIELSLAGNEPGIKFSSSGISIPGDSEFNLCVKAYQLISKDYLLPGVKLHLHKTIPVGAGLGGGSSDAAFFIRLLNDQLELGLSWGELHHYAKQIGSDCSFFITNKPAIVSGRGEEMEPIPEILKDCFLVLVCPPVHMSTKEAYGLVTPSPAPFDLEDFLIQNQPETWKEKVQNDFEKPIFNLHPSLAGIKKKLYELGAVYSSMTGSGSAVYGIFREQKASVEPEFEEFGSCFVWSGMF
jgi:4-diphosphocytidyl-2-C-methyl-D-erythritol kinase